jgi:hypothetical protein
MEIIDAFWEKRNLGVDAMEFNVGIDDDASVVKDIISNEKQYNVVKIPSQNIEVTRAVQQAGYRFAEVMTHLAIRPGELRLNSIQQRIVDNIETSEMNDDDIAQLQEEIRKNIFDTDRVYCDPQFTKQQAANRYLGWINDEQNRGGRLLKHVYKGENVGFEGISNDKSVYLGGMYTNAKHGGFGIIIPVTVYRIGKDNGEKKIIGVVSSSNLSVLRMYYQVGYNTDRLIYIFVKHN